VLLLAVPGVEVWSTAEGRLLASLPGGPFSNAAFTPDNRWLAVGTPSEVQLWDTNSWRYARTVISGLNRPDPSDLFFCEDGSLMNCQASVDRFQLRTMPGFKDLFTLETPHALSRRFTHCSNDGTRLYLLDAANLLYEWDLAAVRQELSLRGLGKEILR
jgi:WD40 repeat protein